MDHQLDQVKGRPVSESRSCDRPPAKDSGDGLSLAMGIGALPPQAWCEMEQVSSPSSSGPLLLLSRCHSQLKDNG